VDLVVLELGGSTGLLHRLGLYDLGKKRWPSPSIWRKGNIWIMDEARQPDLSHAYAQVQERVFARLKPDSAVEERVAQRIASCFHTLEQIQNRLTKTWSQLNKIQETFRQDPLS
jgi:hypothetical protein